MSDEKRNDKPKPDRKARDESIKAAHEGCEACESTSTDGNTEGRTKGACPEGYPEETPADRRGSGLSETDDG